MYPGVGTFVLIRPTQTFYERIKVRPFFFALRAQNGTGVSPSNICQGNRRGAETSFSSWPKKVRAYRGLDTMRLTGLIVGDATTTWWHPPRCRSCGESRGARPFGGGVGTDWGRGRDRLRELRHNVHGMNVGSSAQERQHWGEAGGLLVPP